MVWENSHSVPVASLKMMFSCFYKLDAYDLAAVLLSHHHYPPYPHTKLVSNNNNGCYRAPHYYT